MKKRHVLLLALLVFVTTSTIAIIVVFPAARVGQTAILPSSDIPVAAPVTPEEQPKPAPADHAGGACVFNTVFRKVPADSLLFVCEVPADVDKGIREALSWVVKAQHNDGGWGAGTHSFQGEMNPHAVPSDAATTAMVGLALLRCGNSPQAGTYAQQLNKAAVYLMEVVEETASGAANIGNAEGTQPQVKLGQNIDVVLTSQFLTNLLAFYTEGDARHNRTKSCVEKCVRMIERNTGENGSVSGGAWAGVLQSSFAVNALQSAQDAGVSVEAPVLEKAEAYQMKAINMEDQSVRTDDAAGVVLYSVTSTARSSARDAREAKIALKKAKEDGKLKEGEKVNTENLMKAGYSETEALKLNTAYQVNQAATSQSLKGEVISGFGNNGGEEFLSFLQTGEGMIMSHSTEWKNWYSQTCDMLLDIQNDDGSWSGHHCITSPVFCTATCLLVLGVANDAETLAWSGGQSGDD